MAFSSSFFIQKTDWLNQFNVAFFLKNVNNSWKMRGLTDNLISAMIQCLAEFARNLKRGVRKMKRALYGITVLVVMAFLLAGCGEYTLGLDKPLTVEDIEITQQPQIGKSMIILRLTDEAGKKTTLVSVGATAYEMRVAKCAKKGDKISIVFESAGGPGNIKITEITTTPWVLPAAEPNSFVIPAMLR